MRADPGGRPGPPKRLRTRGLLRALRPLGTLRLLWLLLLPAAAGTAWADQFGPNLRVNQGGDGYGQEAPRIAVGPEGNLYVVWADWREQSAAVLLARSLNSGLSFAPEQRVDPDTLPGGGTPLLIAWPRIAVDGAGVIYVAWISWRTGETGRVYCSRSTDEGLTFAPPVLVSDSETGDRAWPSIAGDPFGGVYVAWCDFRGGEDQIDIYVSRSEDGGEFTPNVRANLQPVGPACTPPLPEVAAGDLPGLIHLVWRQTFGSNRWIYATRSLDGAGSFAPAVEVSHQAWHYDG